MGAWRLWEKKIWLVCVQVNSLRLRNLWLKIILSLRLLCVYPISSTVSYVDLCLCDTAAGWPLLHRRRPEVIWWAAPQDDFLLTSRQHLIQFLWSDKEEREQTPNKTWLSIRSRPHHCESFQTAWQTLWRNHDIRATSQHQSPGLQQDFTQNVDSQKCQNRQKKVFQFKSA